MEMPEVLARSWADMWWASNITVRKSLKYLGKEMSRIIERHYASSLCHLSRAPNLLARKPQAKIDLSWE